MISIYDISGSLIQEVLVSSKCEKVEELMKSDYIKLSWVSNSGADIPAGAYIIYESEKYSLLNNYSPSQKTEGEWLYEPQFESSVMEWTKTPFFMYTTSGTETKREIDWTLTAGASMFLDRIVLAIKNETGVTYTYSSSLTGSKSLSFSSMDIFSSLNSIANEFETEWWVDKANKVIYLSKCDRGGTPVNLQVGVNINTPSIQDNSQGYFNRFYVFGSTRNIVQDYNGANVNNIANKRLTLSPIKYPNGYYEPNGTQSKVFSKILVFDDIYPAATNFVVYDLLARTDYVLDANGSKIQIGTDNSGNPIYDMFTIWYFKLGYKNADGTYTQFFLNNWNYSTDPAKQGGSQKGTDGMLISGLTLSVSFQSGALQGREFELYYHDNSATYGDAQVSAGYFEIKYVKEGDYIIPDAAYLIPKTDDKAVLFNIKMPDSYIADAYERLETKMLSEIQEKFIDDTKQYSFSSNPVAFNASNPSLKIGTSVKYINGSYNLTTRVTSLTTSLDYPCKQSITIGNSVSKGTIQQLKEETTTANKNIEIIGALNNTTSTLANAYARAQQTLIESINAISNLFIPHFNADGTLESIQANAGLWTNSYVSAGGKNSGGGGGGSANAQSFILPAGSTSYSTAELSEDGEFDSSDLVLTLYDDLNRVVFTDMKVASSGTKWTVNVTFKEVTSVNYKLVVIG